MSHIYKTSGQYNIILNGLCPALRNTGNDWQYLTAIKKWGLLGYYDLTSGFCNAGLLSSIPLETFAPGTIYASHCFDRLQ